MLQRNSEIFGMIEGLLEAWCRMHFSTNWKNHAKHLTTAQRHRLGQLFDLLDPKWIVQQMQAGNTSVQELLAWLANTI